jgi:hypothetical protein
MNSSIRIDFRPLLAGLILLVATSGARAQFDDFSPCSPIRPLAEEVDPFDPSPPVGSDPFAIDSPLNTTETTSDADGPKPSQVDFAAIIDLLTETVEPNSWDSWGGPGTYSEHEGILSLSIGGGVEVHPSPVVVEPKQRFSRLRILQRTISRRRPPTNVGGMGQFNAEPMW